MIGYRFRGAYIYRAVGETPAVLVYTIAAGGVIVALDLHEIEDLAENAPDAEDEPR